MAKYFGRLLSGHFVDCGRKIGNVMTKTKSMFFCQECGYDSPKWLGRCPGCGAWNSMREEIVRKENAKVRYESSSAKPQSITSIEVEPLPRIKSGIEEVNRVLGGGIVPNSLLLLGGDPGIGKSTLALQVAMNIAHMGEKVFYVSGEESAAQIRMRAERLGVLPEQLILFAATELDSIIKEAKEVNPTLMIVDSIQTLYLPELSSAPGSISQVREGTGRLLRFAKENKSSVLIIGHVTKDGTIAGPRLLEHMVDGVLYFEGDNSHAFRILRAIKNRFGGTHEVGIFSMTQGGLKEVENPSLLLLEERPVDAAGSAVFSCMEGARPLLIEIQALASQSIYSSARRMSKGFDTSRLALLAAVVEKQLQIPLSSQDIYINVIGGLETQEPAADLAIIAAIISCFRGKSIDSEMVVIGEVGLTGEIRSVPQIELRVREAFRLGYSKFIVPKGNQKEIEQLKIGKIFGVKTIFEMDKIIKGGKV